MAIDMHIYSGSSITVNATAAVNTVVYGSIFGSKEERAKNRKRERDRIYQAKRRRERPNLKRWEGIKARCFNPRHKSYPDYGGRGITMHSLWVDDFKLFDKYLNDFLGRCPDNYTLDRIDNDGNYEPGNLQWADPRQQNFNKGRKVK